MVVRLYWSKYLFNLPNNTMTSDLLKLLKETTVSQIAPKTNEFIIIQADDSVKDALQVSVTKDDNEL